MAAQHQSVTAASPQWERLRDEVYRQMFRMEAGRSDSEVCLATALLRAWMAIEKLPQNSEARQWLRRLCPVCLEMMEAQRVPDKTLPAANSRRKGSRRQERILRVDAQIVREGQLIAKLT